MCCQDPLELLDKAGRLSDGFKEPDRWPCEKTPYEGLLFQKSRLPSIVVEPSQGSDGESGELLWPPEDFPLLEGAEQDEFLAEEEEGELEAGEPGVGRMVGLQVIWNPLSSWSTTVLLGSLAIFSRCSWKPPPGVPGNPFLGTSSRGSQKAPADLQKLL